MPLLEFIFPKGTFESFSYEFHVVAAEMANAINKDCVPHTFNFPFPNKNFAESALDRKARGHDLHPKDFPTAAA